VATTFFLVRHAAHDRVNRVLCGRMPNVVLGALGHAQARSLAERLSRESISAIYSSPLERAQETAAPIAERIGVAPRIADALNEIDFGEWSGRAFDDLDGDRQWSVWNAARGITRPPGGEMMVQAQARALAFLEHAHNAHPESGVVLVSHCDVIKAMLLHCLGLGLDGYQRLEVSPASISTVVVGPWGAKILSINEVVAP